jgi:hypothetical protein
VLAASAALLVWALGSGPPEIDQPDLPAAQDAACKALVSDLPETLVGEQAVEVTGATAYGAAWGDPAIVLTCGVDPVDLSDAPRCVVADGVGWLVSDEDAEGDRDATFTADGYRPRVRVEIPDDYLPEQGASVLAELAAPLKEHLTKKVSCLRVEDP